MQEPQALLRLQEIDLELMRLNSKLKAPYFEASAITGYNVPETLKKIISLTVLSIQKKLM